MPLSNLQIASTKQGRRFCSVVPRYQPSQLISRSDFMKHLGPENVLPHVQAALARASEIQETSMESAES
jgi:SulP family sulfate permease